MCDNDILIARKAGDTVKTALIDGDVADCERQNRRVKERLSAEEEKRRAEAAYHKQCQELKAAMEREERRRRKKRAQLGIAMVASVAALMAMTLVGLIHTVVGMAFIAGDAAVCGWALGRA